MRIAVVGAGPAGLYVAIGLCQSGHDVVVLERLTHPDERSSVNRDRWGLTSTLEGRYNDTVCAGRIR